MALDSSVGESTCYWGYFRQVILNEICQQLLNSDWMPGTMPRAFHALSHLILPITTQERFTCCFPAGSEVKASACTAGDLGSIPGSGRSLKKEMATHFSILAWKIPWTTVGYSPWGHKGSDTNERLHFHFHWKKQKLCVGN